MHRGGLQGFATFILLCLVGCGRGDVTNRREGGDAVPTGSAPASDVLAFVKQEFPEGVPYEEAAALGPSAAPELIGIIKDPNHEAYHAHAATILGIVGGEGAHEALVEYIEGPTGVVSLDRFDTILAATSAMGFLALRNDESLTYLQNHCCPAQWSRLKWRSPQMGDDRDFFLARAAINGLGISGRAAAGQALTKLQCTGLDGESAEALNDSIRENVLLNTRVQRDGPAAVFDSAQ